MAGHTAVLLFLSIALSSTCSHPDQKAGLVAGRPGCSQEGAQGWRLQREASPGAGAQRGSPSLPEEQNYRWLQNRPRHPWWEVPQAARLWEGAPACLLSQLSQCPAWEEDVAWGGEGTPDRRGRGPGQKGRNEQEQAGTLTWTLGGFRGRVCGFAGEALIPRQLGEWAQPEERSLAAQGGDQRLASLGWEKALDAGSEPGG